MSDISPADSRPQQQRRKPDISIISSYIPPFIYCYILLSILSDPIAETAKYDSARTANTPVVFPVLPGAFQTCRPHRE